jgi:hypothetical protein
MASSQDAKGAPPDGVEFEIRRLLGGPGSRLIACGRRGRNSNDSRTIQKTKSRRPQAARSCWAEKGVVLLPLEPADDLVVNPECQLAHIPHGLREHGVKLALGELPRPPRGRRVTHFRDTTFATGRVLPPLCPALDKPSLFARPCSAFVAGFLYSGEARRCPEHLLSILNSGVLLGGQDLTTI